MTFLSAIKRWLSFKFKVNGSFASHPFLRQNKTRAYLFSLLPGQAYFPTFKLKVSNMEIAYQMVFVGLTVVEN